MYELYNSYFTLLKELAMSGASASKSSTIPIKSLCAGSQAVSDCGYNTSAQFKSLISKDDSFLIQVKRKFFKRI